MGLSHLIIILHGIFSFMNVIAFVIVLFVVAVEFYDIRILLL